MLLKEGSVEASSLHGAARPMWPSCLPKRSHAPKEDEMSCPPAKIRRLFRKSIAVIGAPGRTRTCATGSGGRCSIR
jgi:hypothetical protein